MTNLKLSSKMHILIIVSAIIIAIGLAVGLICEFCAGGYFNYGDDYKSYDSVTVSYAYVDFNDGEDVKEICDKAFKDNKINYFSSSYGDTAQGGEYVFKFVSKTKTEKLQTAVTEINSKLSLTGLSNASFSEVKTELGGEHALIFGAIALSSAIVFQFIYFVIRYKLTAALSALLADVHNLAIFVSLLSITRAPLSSSVAAFGALTVIMTMIGCCFLFDRVRKNRKDAQASALSSCEFADLCANESFTAVSVASVGFGVFAVLLFVLMSISALSVSAVLSAVLMSVFAALSSLYGTSIFTPAVYSHFKSIGDNFKASHDKKSKKA